MIPFLSLFPPQQKDAAQQKFLPLTEGLVRAPVHPPTPASKLGAAGQVAS